MRKATIVVDTETTGRNPSVNGILTIGMVTLTPSLEIINPVYITHQIDPNEYEVEPEALRVNGINLPEHNASALPNNEAQMAFDRYVKEMRHEFNMGSESIRFMGYNVGFDIDFLAKFQENFYEDITFPGAKIDVLSMVNEKYLEGRISVRAIKLEKVAAHFGIGITAHNALSDAIATAEVYKIVRGL